MTARPVALATCRAFPDLDEDGPALRSALARRGIDASPAVWDDPEVDWDRFSLVVLRSTWDYIERRDDFIGWVRRLGRVANPAPVVDFNTDKHYLQALSRAGVPVVETEWIEPPAGPSAAPGPGRASSVLEEALARWGEDVVVKPAVSSGARDTARYRADAGDAIGAHVEALLAVGRSVLVQPYVASVDTAGETAVVFFGGRFSHAVRKDALLTGRDGRADGPWWEEAMSPRTAEPDEIAVAGRALAAVGAAVPGGQHLLYARVDVVRDRQGDPLVLEVEITEPSLFLGYGEGAAGRFAEAIAALV